MNNVMPSVTLDALGLNPVIETPWLGRATRHPKTLVLKFALVKELEQFLIIFCTGTTAKCLCTTLSETMSLPSAGI